MNLRRIVSELRNLRTLFTGRAPAAGIPANGRRPASRRNRPAVESLEDRSVPAIYYVDATNTHAGTGTQADPFKALQSAMTAATGNNTADTILVYGNGKTAATTVPYVWRGGNFGPDGNLFVEAQDTLIFRS